ncbi:hypothetical protein [Anabaena sp. PCC 7108]|uniref:TRADD-N-associated membrane domain-containing protein n=1 Tax=Anabaena sp. PCC 7108 TaxID=163908 RepID=UPI000346B399|nr:hypothetical protein [Anabaena sp. PCC 7108]
MQYFNTQPKASLSKPNNPYLAVKLAIVKERLRQAKHSFNFALVVAALSCSITFVGAALLLANKAPEGSVATAAGLLGGIGYTQIAKDANNRLDKIYAELDTDT